MEGKAKEKAFQLGNKQNKVDTLGISDHGAVYLACKVVSAQWRDLGTRLRVRKSTLDIIQANNRGDVERCIFEMIAKWLKRDVLDQGAADPPTWQNLCLALSHIDKPLAESISVEHGCGYISPTVTEVTSKSGVPPAFLPHSCGCGQCTVRGWMTGRLCQNMYPDRRPALLVVNSEHPRITQGTMFQTRYARQARLCSETSKIVDHFTSVSIETWIRLQEAIDSRKCSLSTVLLSLSHLLKRPLPLLTNLHELQIQLHSLRVSWFSFQPLYYLCKEILSPMYPQLMDGWSNYVSSFKEYCLNRNLKDFSSVFFQVEEENIFLLEADECFYNFTLSDIQALRKSLSLALGVPSVCLHLVTVRGGSLIIYFHYCYSDYLTIFKSLTTQQLKSISQIKANKILSLTDLHNQFTYDNIQKYNNEEEEKPQLPLEGEQLDHTTDKKDSILDSEKKELKEHIKLLKEQSLKKDIELTQYQKKLKEQLERTQQLLYIKNSQILRYQDELKKKEEQNQQLVGQLHIKDAAQILRYQDELKKKEAETKIVKRKYHVAVYECSSADQREKEVHICFLYTLDHLQVIEKQYKQKRFIQIHLERLRGEISNEGITLFTDLPDCEHWKCMHIGTTAKIKESDIDMYQFLHTQDEVDDEAIQVLSGSYPPRFKLRFYTEFEAAQDSITRHLVKIILHGIEGDDYFSIPVPLGAFDRDYDEDAVLVHNLMSFLEPAFIDSNSYFHFGHHLCLSVDTMSEIEAKYPLDYGKCTEQLLLEWRRKSPSAPYTDVTDALQRCGYPVLACYIHKKIPPPCGFIDLQTNDDLQAIQELLSKDNKSRLLKDEPSVHTLYVVLYSHISNVWKFFGFEFGLRYPELITIEENKRDSRERFIELVQTIMVQGQQRMSWENILRALYSPSIKAYKAIEEIYKYLLKE